MLANLVTQNIFQFFLVFARIGSAFVLLPGFGEAYVPARAGAQHQGWLLVGLSVASTLAPTMSALGCLTRARTIRRLLILYSR